MDNLIVVAIPFIIAFILIGIAGARGVRHREETSRLPARYIRRGTNEVD